MRNFLLLCDDAAGSVGTYIVGDYQDCSKAGDRGILQQRPLLMGAGDGYAWVARDGEPMLT